MKKDIILAGVGGQGILSIAAVLDWAALDQDLNVKQAEVHGMSQRGGAVQSHLRVSSEEIFSDLIPKGSADIILSVEPLESLRYISFLAEDGWIITSLNSYKNIPDYPENKELMDKFDKFERKIMIDAENLAKKTGSIKTTNMVMLGAATSKLDIPVNAVENGIKALFGRKGEDIVNMNIAALHLGIDNAKKN